MGNYEIKSGDCLWNITKKHFNGTLSEKEIAQKVNELAKANNISNPDLIYAGKELDLSCFSEDKKAKNVLHRIAEIAKRLFAGFQKKQ